MRILTKKIEKAKLECKSLVMRQNVGLETMEKANKAVLSLSAHDPIAEFGQMK
ncbi:hypothetical protein UF75_4261 [Desulfosporosinus sp. I2]|nr:hypothetical protein UF75_4261 [Desulfosporosinus sp. I2]